MSLKSLQAINEVRKGFRDIYNSLPQLAGGKAVTFFTQNFRRQGWVYNGRLLRWEQRAPGAPRNAGRQLLISSGRLWRSIRIIKAAPGMVIVGSDVEYAQAHNEGLRINKRVRVGSHYRKTRSGRTRVNTHLRTMRMEIPKRQFIGESPDVIKSVERDVFRKLETLISKLK